MSNSNNYRHIKGSCVCKSVVYEIQGSVRDFIACHCVQCRKTSGHFFVASATKIENFKLIEDKGLKWYHSSSTAQRGFCGECGSSLFFKPNTNERISFLAGSIDGDTHLALTTHIYLKEKADYYKIDEKKYLCVMDANIDLTI